MQREKTALKKTYAGILKDYLYNEILNKNQKMKEILTDMPCEILKPFC